MLHVPDDSVVVLVDFQTRLMPVIHEGSSVVTQAVRLARIAQILGVPVMGTEQSPVQLGRNVPEIKELCSHTVVKDHFDACAEGWSRPCRTGATASSSPVARRTCACCKQRSGCCAAAAKSRWSAMPWGRVGRSTGTRGSPGSGRRGANRDGRDDRVRMAGFQPPSAFSRGAAPDQVSRGARALTGTAFPGAGCANLGMSAHWRRQVWQAGCRRSWAESSRRRATRRRIVRERLVATLRARDDSSR